MCVRSDVWAAVSSRLQELLTSLDPVLDPDRDPQTTLTTLKGVGLILHLAGLCYSPTRSRSLSHTHTHTHTHTLLQQTHTRVG